MRLFHVFVFLGVMLIADAGAVNVTINPNTTYQTIDGFGAHGGMSTWWSSGPFFNDAFLSLIVDTLGLTINRNEFYAPDEGGCNLFKQTPWLQALKAKAAAGNEPIKFVVSIWTPPGTWKSNASTINGGNLLPSRYTDFGNYLVAAIKGYSDIGIDLYGISLQNEPDQNVDYQSCVYTPATYKDMFQVVAPIIHNSGYSTKVMGPEHYVWTGCGGCEDFRFELPIINAGIADQMDIWCFHDYLTPGSDYTSRYTTVYNQNHAANPNAHLWQTEDCYYALNNWTSALLFGWKVQHGLKYGKLSAWLFWLLGENEGKDSESLTTNGVPPDGRFYVFKHFSRYIRPGAVMVDATYTANSSLLITAFKRNTAAGDEWTIVIVNRLTTPQDIVLSGSGIPDSYDAYQSTSSSQRCLKLGAKVGLTSTVPASSITTLVYKPSAGAVKFGPADKKYSWVETTGTSIRLNMDAAGPAQVKLLDIRGCDVATLLDGRLETGKHTVSLKNHIGSRLPAGKYLAKVTAGTRSATVPVIIQ